MKIDSRHHRRLFWPVSQIDLQHIMHDFLVDGNIILLYSHWHTNITSPVAGLGHDNNIIIQLGSQICIEHLGICMYTKVAFQYCDPVYRTKGNHIRF